MPIFDGNLPYTNLHELNNDWIVKTVKEVKDKTDEIDNAVTETQTNAENSRLYAEHSENSRNDAQDYSNRALESYNNIQSYTSILNAQVQNNTREIAVNSSRIDNIASLTQGSTTGDAELQDIRIAWNGTTYPTAGDSVRGQATIINNKVEDINTILEVTPKIVSNNKAKTNNAIGQLTENINQTVYYFGAGKTLNDFYQEYDGSQAVIKICAQTTDNAINGVTAVWHYDDNTDGSSYITVNSNYRINTIANYQHVVGFKIVVYSAGWGKTISELGALLGVGVITTTWDLYDEEYTSDVIDNINYVNINPHKNKTAVWIGTSIPAGQYDGVGTSYPEIVGDLLDMSITNLSIGASSVRAGNFEYKSSSDPFGWSGVTSMQSLGLSLSLSSSEKQTMFDNWDYWKTRIPNIPPAIADNMNSTYANMYKNASYDRLLVPYLDGTHPMPDVFIFDHGFNDRITGQNMELAELPSDPYDRTYFIGAMAYIFKLIYTYNPKARILLVGHYESVMNPAVTKAQTVLAETYDLPLEKLWKKTGWNSVEIPTLGEWQNGYWQDNVLTTPVNISVRNRWMADGVHPASDKSGEAVNYLANTHARWLENIEF